MCARNVCAFVTAAAEAGAQRREMMGMPLLPSSSVSLLTGIGQKRQAALDKAGIKTVRDLANAASSAELSIPAKARIEALRICGLAAAAAPAAAPAARPVASSSSSSSSLSSSWDNAVVRVWSDSGALVHGKVLRTVSTPVGPCALVKFVRHGRPHTRAFTFQYLMSTFVQHHTGQCASDDEERVDCEMMARFTESAADLFERPLWLSPADAAASFIIQEVADIAQLRTQQQPPPP